MSAKQQAKKELAAITVRLPVALVRELKIHAASESIAIQEVVEKALLSYFLREGGGRKK